MTRKEIELRDRAWPEVETLVKKYGRRVVQSCITRVRNRERTSAELEKKKREVAALERVLAQK